MGDYIYRTSPRLIQPEATIRLDLKLDGVPEIIHRPVAGYVYAYKPYWNADANRKMEARLILPSVRAFEKKSLGVPRYGAVIEDKAPGPKVGDRVFRTHGTVSMNDYHFDRVGVIINLDGSDEDKRSLAQILDPAHYGIYHPSVARYIGQILVHDYGVGSDRSGDWVDPYLAEWKAKLDPAHRELFEQLEHATGGN